MPVTVLPDALRIVPASPTIHPAYDLDTRGAVSSDDGEKDRATSPADKQRRQSADVSPSAGTRAGDREVCELLQERTIRRFLEQREAGGCV